MQGDGGGNGGAGALDLLDEHASFLLVLLDRLLAARSRAQGVRAAGLAHWAALLESQGCDRGAGAGPVIGLIRQHYGEGPLRLPTSDTPEVSVVIPVHNQFRHTHQCLRRIAEHMPRRPIEVIVVDDGSSDETLLMPLLLEGVRMVRLMPNQGFVGAARAGVEAARGRLLMLLNNDTEVLPGWLEALCDTVEADPSIGVAGARLLFADGRLQECGGIVYRDGDAANWGRGADPDRPEFRHMRDVDYVSGAALMVRRDVWERVGGFDSAYAPGYYEDADLCFKAREAGFRVVVQPAAAVVHHEGVSAGRDVLGDGMKRHQRINRGRFEQRWRGVLAAHGRAGEADPAAEAARRAQRRALVIDESAPTPDRDAGSGMVVSHMMALMRLGYQVDFVPADTMARSSPYTEALERAGVCCHVASYSQSAEEVLRRESGAYDVVYLHRLSSAPYLAAARARNPGARVVYAVADLHHLRMERQAALLNDAGLRRKAAAVRVQGVAATCSADVTLVHSTHEAAVLAEAAPGHAVAVVPWAVRARPVLAPFEQRHGVAFVGSTHPPNVDAAGWLVREVMPRVWARAPDLVLTLVGTVCDDPAVQALAGPRVRLGGWAPDLAVALAGVRLTVAPLRYGAGLKGKVLESLALGLPCVLTPCAAEGAGLAHVRMAYSEVRIDALLAEVVSPAPGSADADGVALPALGGVSSGRRRAW